MKILRESKSVESVAIEYGDIIHTVNKAIGGKGCYFLVGREGGKKGLRIRRPRCTLTLLYGEKTKSYVLEEGDINTVINNFLEEGELELKKVIKSDDCELILKGY